MTRTLVIIPTYNETESLPGALERLAQYAPHVHVLVVDDASPDGTGALAEQLAAQDEARHGEQRVHVLHREQKQGLGPAYLAGFDWALGRDYDVVVEMDADGSHRAQDLPRLLARVADADLVIGSRWVNGGRVVNWPWRRLLLSRAANLYTRLAVGMPVKDATAGFRAYRADLLRSLDLRSVATQGFGFQVDMTVRALALGARIVEVPIVFVERSAGHSKMSSAIIVEALTEVTRWGAQRRLAQVRTAVGRTCTSRTV